MLFLINLILSAFAIPFTPPFQDIPHAELPPAAPKKVARMIANRVDYGPRTISVSSGLARLFGQDHESFKLPSSREMQIAKEEISDHIKKAEDKLALEEEYGQILQGLWNDGRIRPELEESFLEKYYFVAETITRFRKAVHDAKAVELEMSMLRSKFLIGSKRPLE